MKPGLNSDPLSRHKVEIVLDSGRIIELTDLHQSRTYAGLLCGYPKKITNDGKIEHDLGKCLKMFPFDCKPVLIPPGITPWPDYPGVENHQGLGLPCETLPMVTSYGLFDSTPTARDDGCNSALVVVWYQDHFGAPADPEILAYLREIDWDSRAVDYMW